jgi:hypothetical protein
VDFCIIATRQTLARFKWLSSLKAIYKVLAFIASLVLLWWSLREIFGGLPPIGKRWWAIVILSTVVCVLLMLIGIIKAFHEKTTQEIYVANEAIKKEYADSAARIEMWTLFKGRFDVLADLLDYRGWSGNAGAPLSTGEIERHEADFHNKLQDQLGPDWTQDYFAKFGGIPDDLFSQKNRMQVHSNQCHKIIQTERARQQSIAAKANQQKQEVLTMYRETDNTN